MSDQSSRLLTVGEIAERHSQPVHRVEYVIRARNIVPIAWAGNARVFSANAAEQIAEALRGSTEQRPSETDPSSAGDGGNPEVAQ